MTERHEYSDGAPCWVDLTTPDLAGAQRFYGGLFGWTFDEGRPELANYVNCRLDGGRVAGVMPIPPGRDMPTVWGVHFKSSDIAAAARRIAAAGGTVVMPPHAVADLGSMMLATDPTGALFGVWQPAAHRGAKTFAAPGAMCWHELNTRDGAAADRFYRAVFDHEQAPLAGCTGMDYARYSRDGRPVCGRLQMTAAWGDLPSHWMTYFAVADVDAAAARLRALDGRLLHGPLDTPLGAMAVAADPYGAVFAIARRAGEPA